MRKTIVGILAGLLAGLSLAGSAAHAVADGGHGKPDIPVWVVRPCTAARVVNCRVEGVHPHSVRQLPGAARMVCVFYAERGYASTHDYCEAIR